jgi:hypothetical protein
MKTLIKYLQIWQKDVQYNGKLKICENSLLILYYLRKRQTSI